MEWVDRAAILILPLVVASCTRREDQAHAYTFTVVQRYGSEQMGPDSLDLSEPARRAGGGVLGSFRGVVQSADSTVYVLDRAWYKIAAFRPDGQLKDVILGGAGEGPGEFRLPVGLGIMQNGDLVVLDYELQRLSFFRQDGELVSVASVDVPGPLRILPAGEEIWLATGVTPGSVASPAIAVDREGHRLWKAPSLGERERPFGSSVNLALSASGDLIIPHVQPGRWDVLAEDSRVTIEGQDLFPDLAPPRVTREGNNITVGQPEAWTVALGVLLDGRKLLLYVTATLDDEGFPVQGTIQQRFALFASDGSQLGTVTLPEDVEPNGWSLYVSPLSGHVFLASDEPYPSVVELDVQAVALE